MAIILKDMKRLKDELDHEETNEEKEDLTVDPKSTQTDANTAITAEEYEEMRNRIRAELTEELNARYDREQSKKQ